VDINPVNSKGADDLMMKDKVIITCDGELVVDYDKNIASFYDNVKVERPDLIIYSDKMDLYFARGADGAAATKTDKSMASSIDRIVASGNVKIVRGENISYSETAEYKALEKKIILSGRPKLIFYSTGELKDASFGN
jgi:lipopolysaccharide export system protein LptA